MPRFNTSFLDPDEDQGQGEGYGGAAPATGPYVIPMNYPQQRPGGFQSFLNTASQYSDPMQRRKKLFGGLAGQAGQGGFMGGLGSVAKFFL